MISKYTNILHKQGVEDTLIVSFSGFVLKDRRHLHKHEMLNTLDKFNCTKVFIIDKTYSWYNDKNSFNEIIHYLKNIINNNKFKKIIFVGGSMGGFGSILFSYFFKVDVVVAFSPQIYIIPDKIKWDDIRRKHILNSGITNFINPDVENAFVKNTEYFIHYGGLNKIDVKHLSYVPDLPNIHKCSYDTDVHNIAQYLKKINKLTQILVKIYNES